MIVERVPVGVNETNCYLVAGDGSSEAVVIDPGDEARTIVARIARFDLSIAKILVTHAHWDHIGAVREIKEHTGAPICCHKDDSPLYDAFAEQLAFMGMKGKPLPPIDAFVQDGDVIEVAGLRFAVLHTPGHSPGSVSYLVGNVLFCGDVLFEGGGVGRTDLPGGSTSKLKNSITDRILTLPPETVIYPGHGPETTVEKESSFNFLAF